MKGIALILLLLVAFVPAMSGQTGLPEGCPAISIEGPPGGFDPSGVDTFVVEVRGKENYPGLSYIWEPVEGKILSGQGTTTIRIQRKGSVIGAAVKVIGLPAACPNSASETSVIDFAPSAQKLDEFLVPIADLNSDRLIKIVDALKQDSNSQLFVFAGHPGERSIKSLNVREMDLIDFLKGRGIDPSYVTVIHSQSPIEILQLWLVPPGATPPTFDPPTAPAQDCPIIKISAPQEVLGPRYFDNKLYVELDPPRDGLSFFWTLTSGSILSGQGTARLKVEPPDVMDCENKEMTATVRVEGLPPGCTAKATREFEVTTGNCDVFPLSEYGPATFVDERAQIDNLAIQMSNNPKAQAFVVFRIAKQHAGRVAQQRLERFRRILKQRKYSADKIAFYYQTSERNLTTMWLEPDGSLKVPDCGDCTLIH
jgi:hypothetical protein